ncbi:MAG: polyprenyl synthetase family protein [Gemmobacter sp.]|uniref:polyprenyl synthetase family protein n=1 Tax=Gemmobacter sp. TaxID=1898957 RepID=UPI00391D3B0E
MSELQSLVSGRIERAMQATILRAQGRSLPGQPVPPDRLAEALHYSVTPGGARIRPTILLSVAMACGDDAPELSDAAAAALELIHCASLVHDDLPAFDDADMRRGKPAVHKAYSEPLAILAGDSLIVQAFTTLAAAGRQHPLRALDLVGVLAARTGMPAGICAGQGWESEAAIDLHAYHMAKTGALFIAATQMGAIAAGQDPEPWTELGARIGAAFQVADDLRDAVCDAAALGKPVGQDAVHGRPSAVAQLGVAGAVAHLQDILAGAIASIPACPGEAQLAGLVRLYARRMVPAEALRA